MQQLLDIAKERLFQAFFLGISAGHTEGEAA
jgi:hypothetical protein